MYPNMPPNQFPGQPPYYTDGQQMPYQSMPGGQQQGMPYQSMPGGQQQGMPYQSMPGGQQQGMPYPSMPGGQQQGMPYPSMPGGQQQNMPYQQYGAPSQYPPMPNQYGNFQQVPQVGAFPQQPPMMMHQQQFHTQQQAPNAYGQQQVAIATVQSRPTVVPSPNFNASNDAGALRKAMKGFGTDEDAIIEVLCRRSCSQRMEIIKGYKTAYGKDLIEDIRSETKANFLNLLLALLTPMTEFYCRELYEAMFGEGTDEEVLIEIMCGLTNREINNINVTYGRMFGKTLEETLKADTSGCFKRLMVALSTGNRDESMITDINAARIDAQELKDAGAGRWGTDESAFNRILCTRNNAQIKLISEEYEKLTGRTLEKDIKKEFSGDIEDGLVAILRCASNRSEFFAKKLHGSMAGIGTDDRALIRLVVTRCEIDMMDIKEAFQKKYGKSLKSFIKGDTSGDYKHALYALLGENRS